MNQDKTERLVTSNENPLKSLNKEQKKAIRLIVEKNQSPSNRMTSIHYSNE